MWMDVAVVIGTVAVVITNTLWRYNMCSALGAVKPESGKISMEIGLSGKSRWAINQGLIYLKCLKFVFSTRSPLSLVPMVRS